MKTIWHQLDFYFIVYLLPLKLMIYFHLIGKYVISSCLMRNVLSLVSIWSHMIAKSKKFTEWDQCGRSDRRVNCFHMIAGDRRSVEWCWMMGLIIKIMGYFSIAIYRNCVSILSQRARTVAGDRRQSQGIVCDHVQLIADDHRCMSGPYDRRSQNLQFCNRLQTIVIVCNSLKRNRYHFSWVNLRTI